MAMRVETNPLEMAYAVLLEHGLEGAGEALRILVNEAAKIERSQLERRPMNVVSDGVTTPTGTNPRRYSPALVS